MPTLRMQVTAAGFFVTATTALLAQTLEPHTATGIAARDLTVSGLLLAAVIFLVRELARERRRADEVAKNTAAFIAEQTEKMRLAAESQSVALGQVAAVLTQLEEANRQQVTIYREHINRMIDAAAKDST